MKTQTAIFQSQSTSFVSIVSKRQMRRYAARAWKLLSEAYAKVPGGLLFKSPKHLIECSHTWHIAINSDGLIAITVHKLKHGLKLVALAKKQGIKQATAALVQMVSHALKTGWMEVSEAFEAFVMKYCQGYRYLLSADIAYRLLQKPELIKSDNQYHYQRLINGMLKTKLALGTPTSL